MARGVEQAPELFVITALILLPVALMSAEAPAVDTATVEGFARLALACVHEEYPNKISHVLSSDEDVRPPRILTPVFYGCTARPPVPLGWFWIGPTK